MTNGELTICLIGMPGSGKSTVANILKRRGFSVIENSAQLKKLMQMYGMRMDVKSVESFVIKMKRAFGRDIFSKLSSKKISGHRGDVAISGPRDPAEIEYIRLLRPGVVVVEVSAPGRVRYERLARRRGLFKISSYREFEWRDRKNIALGIRQSMRSADYILLNTGTIPQLRSDLDGLLDRIRERRDKD